MLIGKFVTLRVMESSDTKMIRMWKNSPDNYKYFANRNFISDSKQEDWFQERSKDPNAIYLIIVENKNNTAIGMTLLESIDHKNQNASWGIYISIPDFRKKIFALESVFLLFNYSFDYLNLYKVYGNTLKENSRGRNFHKYLGFDEEATFFNHVFLDGEFTDLIWISIFRDTWNTKRNEFSEKINNFCLDDSI